MIPELQQDVDRNETGQTDYTKYIRFAKVVKVYDSSTLAESNKYGKVELVWLDTMDRVNGPVSFLKPFYSSVYGCGIVYVPCINDIAACLPVQDAAPMIIGFFSKDQYDAAFNKGLKDGFGPIGSVRHLKSGEILIKGRSQSEIYLKNDGTIQLTVQDGTNLSAADTGDIPLNEEQIVDRPSSSSLNTQVKVVLGDDTEKRGDSAGYGRTLFSIDASAYTKSSIIIDAAQGVLGYHLPIDPTCEIAEIEKVLICTVSNGQVVVKREVTNGINLQTQYKYLPADVGENGATKNPCTLDLNCSFAFITLPSLVAGEIVKGVKLNVQYIAKKRTLAITGNKLGDLFLDARNIVMRSANSNSYLGLFSNGNVRLGGSNIEIGDRLRGHITVDKAGVLASPGISEHADVVMTTKENSIQGTGYSQVFYIKDNLPLFLYDVELQEFRICDRETYGNLQQYDKCDILPRAFDDENTVHGFTEELAQQLIADYKQKYGTEPLTYGQIKTI